MISTDGSDVAEAAAEAAIAFAGRFEAGLHIIHVIEVRELPPGFEDEGADEFASRGKEAVSKVVGIATDADVDVMTAILENGAPIHRAIPTYASDHGVDCIVIGTHGRTGLDRFVFGSVVERFLRTSG